MLPILLGFWFFPLIAGKPQRCPIHSCFSLFLVSFRFRAYDGEMLTGLLTRAHPPERKMPQANLTEKFVAAATAPAGKDRELFWEPALPGFALMVTAAGARSFIVQYRNAAGTSRRMTVNGGSLALAKREARAILGQVAKGADPLAAKRKARDARADTLRRIVEDEYLADPDVKCLRSVAGKRW